MNYLGSADDIRKANNKQAWKVLDHFLLAGQVLVHQVKQNGSGPILLLSSLNTLMMVLLLAVPQGT